MKLTTRGRYALQALIDLSNNSQGRAVKLQDIAERQDLPISYLEQLFNQLRRGKIVKSVRGPGGGYVLARAPEAIMVEDVLRSVKELTSYADSVDASTKSPALQQVRRFAAALDYATQPVLAQPLTRLL